MAETLPPGEIASSRGQKDTAITPACQNHLSFSSSREEERDVSSSLIILNLSPRHAVTGRTLK